MDLYQRDLKQYNYWYITERQHKWWDNFQWKATMSQSGNITESVHNFPGLILGYFCNLNIIVSYFVIAAVKTEPLIRLKVLDCSEMKMELQSKITINNYPISITVIDCVFNVMHIHHLLTSKALHNGTKRVYILFSM